MKTLINHLSNLSAVVLVVVVVLVPNR